MRAFHADAFTLALPAGHRFPMGKYARLRERVASVLPGVRLETAPAAGHEALRLAHAQDYVDAVLEGTLTPAQQRAIGLPWSPRLVERSRRSVGATIAAAGAALDEGVALQLAGGTHHAHADRGSGWCVFNDVAVAARVVQRSAPGASRRVAVVDLDVHQGDGTAAIFAGDASVYTLSLHARHNFPARKAASTLDVALPDDCGDEAYLAALDAALEAMWAHHGGAAPALVFYVAGVDPHVDDRLGRLALSAAGLAERDRRVFAGCRARGVPVAVTMAGGYGEDIEAIVALHLATVQEAWASWVAWATAGAAEAMPQSPR